MDRKLIIVLSALVLTDINNYISKLFDTSQLFSPLILVLSLYLIFSNLKKRYFRSFNQGIGLAFLFCLMTFLMGGSFAAMIQDNYKDILFGYRVYLPTILLFLSLCLGYMRLVEQKGVGYLIELVRRLLFINVILLVASYLFGFSLVDTSSTRSLGISGNPNQAAFISCIFLAIELNIFSMKKSKISYITIGLSLLAVLLTSSKTGFLIVLVLIIMMFSRIKVKIIFGRIFQFIIGSFLFILVLNVFFSNKLKSIFTDSERIRRIEQTYDILSKAELNNDNTTGRAELANIGFRRIKDFPILGSGLMFFGNLENADAGVHNQFLRVWGDSGLLALLSYLGFYFFTWKISRALTAEMRNLVGNMFIVWFLYSLTNHNMFSNKIWIVTVVMVAVVAISSMDRNSLKGKKLIKL